MKGVLKNLYIGIEGETAVSLLRQRVTETDMAIVFPSDKAVQKSLYNSLSALSAVSAVKFFFILPANGGDTWDHATEAGRFFFLSNYCYGEGSSPMLAFQEGTPATAVELFGPWCSAQGLGVPYLRPARAFGGEPQQKSDLFYIDRGRREQYLQVLQSVPLKWGLQPVVVQVTDVEDYGALKMEVRRINEALVEDRPDIYGVLQTIAVLEDDRRRDKEMLKFLHQEVQNLKIYNEQLRAGDETEKILRFYHAQYEVLPLWYKRFGHVIKILMGKRKISFTFKKEDR